MFSLRIENQRWIWLLGLGYFAFYIPYTALTKALSLGLLPGMTGPVSGSRILPATAVATSVALIAIPNMTGLAKSPDRAINARYFYEETLVAALALTAVPALCLLIG